MTSKFPSQKEKRSLHQSWKCKWREQK